MQNELTPGVADEPQVVRLLGFEFALAPAPVVEIDGQHVRLPNGSSTPLVQILDDATIRTVDGGISVTAEGRSVAHAAGFDHPLDNATADRFRSVGRAGEILVRLHAAKHSQVANVRLALGAYCRSRPVMRSARPRERRARAQRRSSSARSRSPGRPGEGDGEPEHVAGCPWGRP
jgi:hypothetical protein